MLKVPMITLSIFSLRIFLMFVIQVNSSLELVLLLSLAIIWSDGCAAQFRSRYVFKLLSTYRLDLLIDWHYNEAHHGKGPMDGIGRSIENVVFRHVKSERIIINSVKEFSEAANQFCPSITTLFQRSDAILSESIDIEEAPIIPGTLKIHNLKRSNQTATREVKIDFFFLSNSKEPCFTQIYTKQCGHVDRDFDSLAQFRNTYAKCMGKHMDVHETKAWLRCPVCVQWFHEACFFEK